MENILEIQGLRAEVEGKEILKGVELVVPRGETHVLLGPNGVGKTVLISAILGDPNVKVTGGTIKLKGEEMSSLPMHERVRKGIGVMFQSPPQVNGVTLKEIACICSSGEIECDVDGGIGALSESLNLEGFLERDVNAGFSGGERKRSELFQLMLQEPDLALIDEPDSGVDVENLKLIGKQLNSFLEKRGALVVTHMGAIFDYLETDWGHVMLDGRIACSEKPMRVMKHILEGGFEKCVECLNNERC